MWEKGIGDMKDRKDVVSKLVAWFVVASPPQAWLMEKKLNRWAVVIMI